MTCCACALSIAGASSSFSPVRISFWLFFPFYCLFVLTDCSARLKIFSRNFQGCCLLLNCQSSLFFAVSLETAHLLYLIHFCLSRTFYLFFQVLFKLACRSFDSYIRLTIFGIFVNTFLFIHRFVSKANGEGGI